MTSVQQKFLYLQYLCSRVWICEYYFLKLRQDREFFSNNEQFLSRSILRSFIQQCILHRQEISIHNFTPTAAHGRIQHKISQFQIMEGKKEINYGSLTSRIPQKVHFRYPQNLASKLRDCHLEHTPTWYSQISYIALTLRGIGNMKLLIFLQSNVKQKFQKMDQTFWHL